MSETLEGLYHRGEVMPPVVLVPPHPREGGSMDSALVAEVAWAVTRAGHATLRFNFRGVGASSGRPGGPGADLADLDAALVHHAETTGAARLGVCAFAGGAAVALRGAATRAAVGKVVLVAPEGDDLGPAVAALAAAPARRFPVLVLALPGADLSAFAPLGDAARAEVLDSVDLPRGRGLPALGHRVAEAFSARSPGG